MMKSNNQKNIKKANKKRRSNLTQSIKQNKKITNVELARFYDMNQVEWFPIDQYCD